MNLAVDQPTKMIRLDLATDRTQRKRGNAPSGAAAPEGLNIPGGEPAPNAFEDRWAEAAMLAGRSPGMSKSSAIDFYRLFSADEEAAAEAPGEGTERGEGAVLSPYTPGAAAPRIDFLIISLRNDIRVRSFDLNESSVSIHFWTIDDAISFYRQYFSFGAMRFSAPHRWNELLPEPRGAPVRFQAESRKVIDPQFQQIEPDWDAKPSGCGGDAPYEASDDELVGRAVVLNKISLVLRKMHGSGLGYRTEGAIVEACRSCNDGAAEWGLQRAAGGQCGAAQAGCGGFTAGGEDRLRAADEHTGAVPRPAERSKEQLMQRVEYFNRMKNFFSKSDVKKMQTLYDEGRLSFLYQNSKEISCGCFSNVVMQNAVKSIGDSGLCEIIANLGEDIVPISATKYGAYTVQTIILCAASVRSQRLISQHFAANGQFLIDHEIGNYSIQKILRFDDGLVFDLCMASFPSIISSGLGFKVFKRCAGFFKDRSGDVKEMIRQHEVEENADKCKVLLQLLESN